MLRYEAICPTDPKGFLDTIYAVMPSFRRGRGGGSGDAYCGASLFIFDTETTGVSPKTDCIVEIGCVEMVREQAEEEVPARDDDANASAQGRSVVRLTGRNFHRLCRPYAPMHPKAAAVHGLTMAVLSEADSVEEGIKDFVGYIMMRDGNARYHGQSTRIDTASSSSPTLFNAVGGSILSLQQRMAAMSITKAHRDLWSGHATTTANTPMSATVATCPSLDGTANSLNGTGRSSAHSSAAYSICMASPALAAPQFADDEGALDDGQQTPRQRTEEEEGQQQQQQHGDLPPLGPIAFCGHNVSFDVRMLTANAKHFGLDRPSQSAQQGQKGGEERLLLDGTRRRLPPFDPSDYPSLCTMALFKRLYPGQSSNTLDSCCEFFGINRNMTAAQRCAIGDYRLKENPNQHSALTDAHATGLLLEKMIAVAEECVHGSGAASASASVCV